MASKKHDSRQPTFDFDGDTTEVTCPSVHDAERLLPATWHEVPAARFLSWSDEMQRAYCAARDRDSALSAVGRGEDPAFYLRRAEFYAL